MTNNEHINEDGKCYCGSLVCVGNLTVMLENYAKENTELRKQIDAHEKQTATGLLTENADLKAQIERLTADVRYITSQRDRNAETIKNVTEFIQGSIDRDEWTEDELQEIFWEELTNYLEIDLKQTEEIEITVTLTYSGTVTVPKGTDVGYLEIGNTWSLEVDLDGNSVGEVTQDDTEIERSY